MRFIRKLAIGLFLYLFLPAGLIMIFSTILDNQGSQAAKIAALVRQTVSPSFEDPDSESEITIAAPADPVVEPQIREVKIAENIKSEDIQKTIEQDDDINKIPLEFADQSITSEDILSDKFNRLPQDFKIPSTMKNRVRFWLDIYTKYSSHFSVVHDAEYPWIVYRVIDLRPIYEVSGNRFARAARDQKLANQERNKVRGVLWSLSRKKSFNHLSEDEFKIFKLFEDIPGRRQAVFRKAARLVRDQRGQKDFFRKGLINGSMYLNEMEEIFARYDLPVELVRVPLVESSFNETAQSKVGASGVWQFMPEVGKKYLAVGTLVDERNSPIKATEAAAKLMLENFRILRSWPLAVTAYNHGLGTLIRASRRSKTIDDLIAQKPAKSFGFASQNYYSEFLAALYGEKYQDEVFGQIAKHPPLLADTIDLKRRIRTGRLIELVGITLEELKLYNPDLKARAVAANTYLPSGYHVRIPKGKKGRLDVINQSAGLWPQRHVQHVEEPGL